MIKDFIFELFKFIGELNYWHVGLLAALESTAFPVVIPVETVIIPMGYYAFLGTKSLPLLMLFCTIGIVIGCLINYWFARALGRTFIYKHAKLLHINIEKLQKLEAKFLKHGRLLMFVGRFIPIPAFKHIITIPAGMAKMPLLPFIFYNALGGFIFSTSMLLIGYFFGSSEELIHKAIGKFTSKVTPVMCSLYVLSAFLVCLLNIHHLPETVVLIIREAFSPKAMAGGAFACLLWGFRRAMFANESGLGTAPIAFSAVNTNKPVVQAFISMLQPLVDTVIVGVATAFVIVVSKAYLTVDGIAGIELTSKAFGTICPFFPILLTIMASCFVLSTMLCGSYYGVKAWNFLFGEGVNKTRTFQIIYCVCIIAGSAMNFQSIINLSDAVTLFLAVPNLIAVFMLSGVVIKELKRYCERYDIGGSLVKYLK